MRSFALLVVVALEACVAGGGPVVAVRTNGDVAVGLEANAGLVFTGLEAGAMFRVHAHDSPPPQPSPSPAPRWVELPPAREPRESGFVALTGTVLWNHDPANADYFSRFSTGVHGELGLAWGQAGLGVLAGIAPEISSTFGANCETSSTVFPSFNVRLGMRWFGKIAEFYLAPTIDASTGPICN